MPRIVVLGCGTGVGKTRVSVALTRALARARHATLGLKPIESGVQLQIRGPTQGSDAHALAEASSVRTDIKHPLYALAHPVSAHLAARLVGLEILVPDVTQWVSQAENDVTPLVSPHMAVWSVIETAGGVFSPISQSATNFDLAQALDPAIWVLVGADALGVLPDVSATLQAMQARGRPPNHVVLSAAREPDASTGTNARELNALGIVTPTAVLGRDDDRGIDELIEALTASQPQAT
jgi:dethiobiotin synthetase